MATSPAPHDPYAGHSPDWWQGRIDLIAESLNQLSIALDRAIAVEVWLAEDLKHFAPDARADSDSVQEDFVKCCAHLYWEQDKAHRYTGRLIAPSIAIPESVYPYPPAAS